jgi:hypothetical protein
MRPPESITSDKTAGPDPETRGSTGRSTDLPAVVTGVLSAVGFLALAAIVVAGASLGLRHSIFEPIEEKAAFETVVESTDEELAARPLGELLTLTDQVHEYRWDHPGAYSLAEDAKDRLEKIIWAKQSRGE